MPRIWPAASAVGSRSFLLRFQPCSATPAGGNRKTSVCQWVGGYWDVLIDLYTVEESVSDLALSVRVYETAAGYEFDIQSVHVP